MHIAEQTWIKAADVHIEDGLPNVDFCGWGLGEANRFFVTLSQRRLCTSALLCLLFLSCHISWLLIPI